MKLTPEELQAALGIAPEGDFADDQARMLAQQHARAEALRSFQVPHHTTGLGAALGGLGAMLNVHTGNQQVADIEAKQRALSQSQAKNAMLIGPKSLGTAETDPWETPPQRGAF